MSFHAYIAVTTVLLIFITIQVRRRIPTDLLFLGGLVVVTISGVIPPQKALEGFSNPAILTIGSLLVCAAGLRNTGILDWIGHLLLGRTTTEKSGLRRIGITMIAASAFVLNTAIVAMLMPVVLDWCRKREISPSRLLIPISYFAILGGVCTLIGTSTTIVANSQLETKYSEQEQLLGKLNEDLVTLRNDGATNETIKSKQDEVSAKEQFTNRIRPMRLFEIGYVGLPCAIVGGVVLMVLGPKLLPDRPEIMERLGDNRREYLVEMLVTPECRLIGKQVDEAGLRRLPGLFLIEITRGKEVITPVNPQDVIRANDRLLFTGIVEHDRGSGKDLRTSTRRRSSAAGPHAAGGAV